MSKRCLDCGNIVLSEHNYCDFCPHEILSKHSVKGLLSDCLLCEAYDYQYGHTCPKHFG